MVAANICNEDLRRVPREDFHPRPVGLSRSLALRVTASSSLRYAILFTRCRYIDHLGHILEDTLRHLQIEVLRSCFTR